MTFTQVSISTSWHPEELLWLIDTGWTLLVDEMFDLTKEWSISFAGCGFMGIYYVGATSCIRERFPRLLQEASRMYGASAGSLMAAILTIGIPLGKWSLLPPHVNLHSSLVHLTQHRSSTNFHERITQLVPPSCTP